MSSAGTGYGPRKPQLYFDGDPERFELFLVKFKAHLRLNKLLDVLSHTPSGREEEDAHQERNAIVFAELVQCLDDKSLSLIIRDASDDGRKALEILREHYLGSTKPRIISLYGELTSLKKQESESVTDYVIRAERASTLLKNVGENVSDGLLIAMLIRGLPDSFKAFITVITQKDDVSFEHFKSALRSYEENEKARLQQCEGDEVMVFTQRGNLKCFSCGKEGHKKFQCSQKGNKSGEVRRYDPSSRKPNDGRWCRNCRSKTHDTAFCRKRNAAKFVTEARDIDKHDDDIVFGVTVADGDNGENNLSDSVYNLLVDCGATTHIVTDPNKFIRKREDFNPENHYIELADGTRQNNVVVAKGDARVSIINSVGVKRDVILEDALCIPSFKRDILSVKAVTNHGAKVIFTPGEAELTTRCGETFKIRACNNLYYLNNVKNVQSLSLKKWHKIMGHCNAKDLIKLEACVDGMSINKRDSFSCPICIQGKMVQYRNHDVSKRSTAPLQLVFSDLAGPVSPVSKENSRYVMSFVDDYSGLIFVYFLKNKNDSIRGLERFLADSATFGKLQCLRSDNGTEYTSKEFKSLLTRNKVKQEFTAPHSPHQNGKAERAWRSIFDMARCMLLETNLPKFLWNYAVRRAAYIRNRCYSNALAKTPFEAFTGRKPDLSSLQIFGSRCFASIQDKKKLDDRAQEGTFLGQDPLSPALLVYFKRENTIRRVRCVKFLDENVKDDGIELMPKLEEAECWDKEPSVTKKNVIENVEEEKEGTIEQPLFQRNEKPTELEERRYPSRQRTRPSYLEDYVDPDDPDVIGITVDQVYHMADVPASYSEAMSSPDAAEWQMAMENEMSALRESKTFDLTQRPKHKSVIDGRWVYALKEDSSSEKKYKARFVARGFTQKENIDYGETFSPTARLTSVRMLMDVAVHENLILHQMDVTTAYLHADIDYELYVEQPTGFIEGSDMVLKLKKSLYGLKQSGRNWNNLLHSFLLDIGFNQSLCDYCVYSKCTGTSKTILVIYVDDLIIAASNDDLMKEIKISLSRRFKMKDLGVLSLFLGIEFSVSEGFIEMKQKKYIDKILTRFGMMECNPKTVPCDVNITSVDRNTDSNYLDDPRLYREMVGNLLYLMTCTRPDLCFAVTRLSQFLARPRNQHLNICKSVLRYLRGTTNLGLTFVKTKSQIKLLGFCDSDWGGSCGDRKSISGYCYRLSDESSLVSWRSRRQQAVALSTCEAEYMAMSHAIQEGKFIRQLLFDLHGKMLQIDLFADNQGAINLAKNPVSHQRSKHIDIRYHFIRSEVNDGNVILNYIPSNENVADLFTKPSTKVSLLKFRLCK